MTMQPRRRPGHHGQRTTQSIRERARAARPAPQRPPRVDRDRRLVGRWTRNAAGQLVMEWTLALPRPTAAAPWDRVPDVV